MLNVHYKDSMQRFSRGENNYTTPAGALNVMFVEADGFELQLILMHVNNLPHVASNEKQVWFGDHAKFIYANLNLIFGNKSDIVF